MSVSPNTVFRVRGLPSNLSLEGVRRIIERSLGLPSEVSGLNIESLAEDFYKPAEQVATLSFPTTLPEHFTTTPAAASNEWSVDLSNTDYDSTIGRSRTLKFDAHFWGLTALNDPLNHEQAIDCVVVCGLGGHAFGSFKHKGTPYMWLRDTLPKDLPNLRILLYGYDSGLDGSKSLQNISTLAEAFISHLRGLRSQLQTIPRPLIMIAHSLGGLIVKQAIIKLGRGDESDKKQMQSIVGLVFFGVPNRGMDIASLRAIVGDQPNRYIIESIGQHSDLLLEQDIRFGLDFHFRDSPIFSFYEDKFSPTAVKIDGVWKMAGEPKLLVGPFSAKHPRHWEPEHHHEPLNRTHSDLVKFSAGDLDYERVHSRLREIVTNAKETLISRYLDQESPTQLSADEEACLRSLSFTQMNAREGRVESAAPDTGDWLLQSQDFKDWAQRKCFHQHHGFFWIQGNPGSGKSTLIKKAYSHIRGLSQDPTSIVAAFFFNARGDEIEKSPAGLFRTILHYLCQHISALRAIVMKQYYRKRRLLNTGWQWQFSELKELLSSAVTASILWQRNLILLIDALDECDLSGAKSIILFFEDLANCSIREKTKFNICLSSRYWPQFTIRHCFKANVELENHADIASYIQQNMTAMQEIVTPSDLDTLETKLKDKAKGTFLWVVLVVQELLSALENGATPVELDGILQRIPPDLRSFYRYQMQSTGDDETLSLFQCVFYSLESLNVKELRYLLAFGREKFSSSSEWAQSNDYVMNDTQLEKRIRNKSKGLVEIIEVPNDEFHSSPTHRTKRIVQFIHQTVRDFLMKDGFEILRGRAIPNDAASGNEFLKVACFNYLNTTDLQSIPVIDFRFYSDIAIRDKIDPFLDGRPLLVYAVDHLFPHAALAEENGVSQDYLRSNMSDNVQGSFERWKYLNDFISVARRDKKPHIGWSPLHRAVQGPEARPLHIFAQYGLLVPGMKKLGEDPNIFGGLYDYPLLAAAANGHQDAVRYLLDLGADLRVSSASGQTAYDWASFRGHAEVLKMLLEHPRSFTTLEQRIHIASVPLGWHNKQINHIIALLIPEVSIPVSAIGPICQLIDSTRYQTLVSVSLILDKCEAALLRHKSLLYACVASPQVGLGLIERLLNCLESVEMCEKLLDALRRRDEVLGDIHFLGENDKIAMILFERCNVNMTENFINKVILLRYSSQLLNHLATRGIEIPPLSCNQIMSALRNGSPESVAFFVQHAPPDTNSDKMLFAVTQNVRYSDQAVRVLLGLRNIDRVCEDTMTSILRNRRGLSVLETFEDQWGPLTFSTNALAKTLSSTVTIDVVKFVISRCEHFSITESLIHMALKGTSSDEKIDLLLAYDPTFKLQDDLLAKTATSGYGDKVLRVYARHGKPLVLTENVVRAAASNSNAVEFFNGVEVLDFTFRHDSNAKISDRMILEAVRSPYGPKLITWMLEIDPNIRMQEDFLIEAASNPYQGALILEAFYQQGRISAPKISVRAPRPPPAKLSSNPLPPLRERDTKSAPITARVIKAAAANKNTKQRRKLLSLFQTWGVLTDEDVELFRFSNEHVTASLSDNTSSA